MYNRKIHLKFNCQVCSKEFDRVEWQIRAWRTKFCSKECAYKWRVCTMTFQKWHADLVPKSSRWHSQETRAKMTIVNRANRRLWKDHPLYTGYDKTERKKEMSRYEYREWRTSVFERDSYTCQECNKKWCYLEADHIKPWCKFPELRYAINNWKTLCRECHMNTPTWWWKAKNIR